MADPAQHKRGTAPGLADQWRHGAVIRFCVSASWRLLPFWGRIHKPTQLPSFAAYDVPLADLITGQCTSLVIGRQSHRSGLELQHHSAAIE